LCAPRTWTSAHDTGLPWRWPAGSPLRCAKGSAIPLPGFRAQPHVSRNRLPCAGNRRRSRGADPLVGRERSRPIHTGPRGCRDPLRFLDYLIRKPSPGRARRLRLLGERSRPGRFALQQLIVAARRGPTGMPRPPRIAPRPASCCGVLLAELPGEITLAWKALSTPRQGLCSAPPAVRSSA